MFEENRFENLLKSFRVRKGKVWTQVKTAKLLDVSLRTYVGWENGEGFPSQRDLKNIAATFQLSDADTDILFRAASQVAPETQNLPFPQNPFFTGRETLLEDLGKLFEKNDSVAITQPISISGLGGIGKTQLALEYAHRCYPKVYRCVLWANASDKATLEASYLSLAGLLKLPEKNEHEVGFIIQAVKTWLERHTNWLLILDNADDLQLARFFLPTNYSGHILLTTRSQIVGDIAEPIVVEALEPEEGLLFLLRRSHTLKHGNSLNTITSNIRDVAIQLVKLLGGHPLALDQAGAYLEETGAPFIDYIQLYHKERRNLLNRRGLIGDEHPETVVVTFEVSFKKACELYPMCADILNFCAFLHPDAIPEKLLSLDECGLKLTSLTLGDAITALRRYSLVKRNGELKILSIHRLIQAVLQDKMELLEKKKLVMRAIAAVQHELPGLEPEMWDQWEQYLPHVQVCVNHLRSWEHISIDSSKRKNLAHEWFILILDTTTYLQARGRYSEAESLCQHIFQIEEEYTDSEEFLVVSHPFYLAHLFYRRGDLSLEQGKYAEAELYLKKSISLFKDFEGKEKMSDVQIFESSMPFNSLAELYKRVGRFAEAEPLFQQVLNIREQTLGAEHSLTARVLGNLASLCMHKGEDAEAESLFLRALSILEKNFNSEHLELTFPLHNLGILYANQGKFIEAESFFRRAIYIREKVLGSNHNRTAESLAALALVYLRQENINEAKSHLKRALYIQWQTFTLHPQMCNTILGLARLYIEQNQYLKAKGLFQINLYIVETYFLPDQREYTMAWLDFMKICVNQGWLDEVEHVLRIFIALKEEKFGPTHPYTMKLLNWYREIAQSIYLRPDINDLNSFFEKVEQTLIQEIQDVLQA